MVMEDAADEVDVSQLQDVDSIRKHLIRLREKERKADGVLREQLTHSSEIEDKMASLQRLTPLLGALYQEAWDLSEMVGSTCALAENVSSKVKELDLTKGRVQACSKRVVDVIDLKACVDGVQDALAASDYEKAAWHVHRYLVFDKTILEQELDMESNRNGVSAADALKVARESLTQIVNDKFDAAVEARNESAVLRFFKLFPLINLRQTGLKKYGRYLCSQIAQRAEANMAKVFRSAGGESKRGHVNLLTMLFEDIARMIEQQEPVVDTQYGPGNMMTLVVLLQEECDNQSSRIIKQFVQDRNFDEKVDLVQMKLLPGASDERGLDPRELDPLLTETTLLMNRAALFFRFIKNRIQSDVEILAAAEDAKEETDEIETKVDRDAYETMIRKSDLNRRMQLLSGHYIAFEEYFLKINVDKALQLDQRDPPNAPTSTVVDDVFYLMKKSARRAVSSSSLDCVCAMFNHISAILEKEYRNHFDIREFPASGIDFSGVLQGRLGLPNSIPTVGSSGENEARRENFVVTLNNLETSTEYTKKLVNDLTNECKRSFPTASATDQNKLESVTADLAACGEYFKNMLQAGLEKLCSGAVDPQIKPLADLLLQYNYELTEDELASYDSNSPFMTSFIAGIQSILTEFKDAFVGSVNDAFIAFLTEQVASELERVVMKSTFNRLGGVQFDRDIRGLVAFLSTATTWTVRDKFARLSQIATVLNLEKVAEISEYWGINSGPLTWRLTPMEVRRSMGLRVDFSQVDIASVKL